MPRIRSLSAIGLALLCGIAVLLLIIFLTGSLTLFSQKPSDFLPAEDTIAVLHNADAQLIEQYASWLPILQDLSIEEQHGTIAIVQTGEMQHLIRFTRRDLTATPRAYWPFTVDAEPEALQLLESRIHSLTKKSGYREFSRTKKRDASWVYLHRDSIPNSSSFYAELTKKFFLQDTEFMSFVDNSIELYQPWHQAGRAPQATAPQSNSILSLSSWNLHALLSDTLDDTVLTAFVQKHVSDVFGTSVSFAYDILALFAEQSSLTVRKLEDDTLQFTLHITHENPQHIQPLLHRLFEARSAQFPQIELLEMQLDRQFTMRTLRNNPTPPEHIGLYMEQQDDGFIVSNYPIEHEAVTPAPLPVPESAFILPSVVRTAGWVDTAALKTMLHELVLEETEEIHLPFLPRNATHISWLWEKRGPLTVITFSSFSS